MAFENLCIGLNEEGLLKLKDLHDWVAPEVVEKAHTAAELANVAAEDMPKFLPQLIKNDFDLLDTVGRTGQAVVECAQGIGRVNKKAGAALAVGCLAIGGCYYLYTKYKNQEARIRALEQKVHGA